MAGTGPERRPSRRAGVVRSRQARREWAERHPFCQACGVPAGYAPWPGLSVHHLARPVRSDEPCNLLMLCDRCHRLAHGECVRLEGVRLPNLTPGTLLTLKRLRDAREYDPMRLAELLHRAEAPGEEPVPGWFLDEYRRRRPWEFGG